MGSSSTISRVRSPGWMVWRSSGNWSARWSGRATCGSGRRARQRLAQRRARAGVHGRQVEREGAAEAGRAAQGQLAAQQLGQLAADGEAEARAAVLAAGAGVGLLEGLEHDLLLLDRDADAGVGDLEGHHRARLVERHVVGAPAGLGRHDAQAHAALGGELQRVAEQVLQDLLQALGIGDDAAAEMLVDLHLERQALRFGLVAERPRHGLEHVGEEDLLGVDGDGAGFDLGEIEDVADQVQKVGAGAVDGAGELDLLGREVAFGILGELLAQDQDRVERRAQLVAHVGQELRLVARGQRQLRRLLFDGAAGLLDLLVLALDLEVALGELGGLLLELLVGLLQLALLGLQLASELLRLFEQALGLHGGFDRVQHDADRGGELLEEGDLQLGEVAERRELDHRLDLALEQHGQHDDALGRRLEQAGADRMGRRRQVGDQDLAAVGGALADQAFADADGVGMARPRIGVDRQEIQRALALLVGLGLVDHRLMRADERRQLAQQQAADRAEVALALQHVGELGEVGLQPILLGVALRRQTEVVDHGVELVLELGRARPAPRPGSTA